MRDLYADDMPIFSDLTDEEAGALMVTIIRHKTPWQNFDNGAWYTQAHQPSFYRDRRYRLVPVVPTDDSIDWEQVSPEITEMHRVHRAAKAHLYGSDYRIIARAEIFTSYKQGTKPTSIIRRPE